MSHMILTDRSKTEQSSKASAITKTSATMKLDKLPEVCLRRILEFLLSTKEVRQTASAEESHVIKYNFHTAILRVNKSIRLSAQSVFSLNHFILISTNEPNIIKHLDSNHLRAWKDRLVKFKGYHARLNMKLRFLPPGSAQKYHFCLICLDQIPEFTRLLHLYELNSDIAIAFKFEIKDATSGSGSSMPLTRQQDFLLPFTKIQSLDQKCRVIGAADVTLARRVEAAMSPTILWLRARAWAVYNAALEMKSIGDTAFKDKNFSCAHHCYVFVSRFLGAVKNLKVNVTVIIDENFKMSIFRLSLITWFNMKLAGLYLARSEGDGTRYIDLLADCDLQPKERSLVSDADFAAYQYFRGIAAFASGRLAVARQAFAQAAHADPSSSKYGKASHIASTWMWCFAHRLEPDTSLQQDLKTLFDLLPEEPLAASIYLEDPVETSLAFESYMLEKLGYRGDKLTWLVELAGHDWNDPKTLNKADAEATIKDLKNDPEWRKGDRARVIGAIHMWPDDPVGAPGTFTEPGEMFRRVCAM